MKEEAGILERQDPLMRVEFSTGERMDGVESFIGHE